MAKLLHNPTRSDAAEKASFHHLLTTSETALVLGIGKRTLQEKLEAREIGCVKIGRSTRFSQEDITGFIERNRVKAIGWKVQPNRGDAK